MQFNSNMKTKLNSTFYLGALANAFVCQSAIYVSARLALSISVYSPDIGSINVASWMNRLEHREYHNVFDTSNLHRSHTVAFFLRWSDLIYCQNRSNLAESTRHAQDYIPSFVINHQRQIPFWYQVRTPCHVRTSRVVVMFNHRFNRLYV
jgi:hypothetical protein